MASPPVPSMFSMTATVINIPTVVPAVFLAMLPTTAHVFHNGSCPGSRGRPVLSRCTPPLPRPPLLLLRTGRRRTVDDSFRAARTGR